MTMHKNYINILLFYYNFRVQRINDAIIEMDCNKEYLNMVNVAADIDEVRDVILALMPRLHMTLVKRECEGCTLYHSIQTQHRCLDPVDEGSVRIRIDQCLTKCTGELIRMVYVSNNKPMPNIEVRYVLEIHRQLIIDRFQIGNKCSVSAEEMIQNFMPNMDLFSYKKRLYFYSNAYINVCVHIVVTK